MAITKEQKKKIIEKLEEKFSKMKSLVFIDYYGLKVQEIDELRKLLKNKNCQYFVAKKTLLKLTLKKLKLNDIIDLDKIEGGVGLVFGYEDEIAPAKIVANFAKEHDKLTIQAGFFNSSFIDSAMVSKLAKLPTKKQLLAEVVGSIKAPITNFVYTIKGNLKKLVYVLEAIKSKS